MPSFVFGKELTLRASRAAIVAIILQIASRASAQDTSFSIQAQLNLADAQLVHGRLNCRFTKLHPGTNAQMRSRPRQELLRFASDEHGPTLHYEQTTAERRLTIDADRIAVKMSRETLRDGQVDSAVRFAQLPDRPLLLECTRNGDTRTMEADSIWHFWLADPALCEEHLAPLCELLDAKLPWRQFGQALEERLYEAAAAPPVHDLAQWKAWIAELGAEEYAARESADRNLRAAGTSLLPFVRRLDPESLDAEQRLRLRRIIAELQSEVAVDTVDTTAEWLRDDPAVWVELLARAGETRRATASAQLERLLGRPVRYEPDADEATRAEQLNSLREAAAPRRSAR